jgi:hypothetical protein
LASPQFRSIFQGEGEEFFVFTILYAGGFRWFKKIRKNSQIFTGRQEVPIAQIKQGRAA